MNPVSMAMPAPTKPISFDYPQQDGAGKTCTAQAWAQTPPQISGDQKAAVINRIKTLLIEKDAAIVAHYYVDGEIQDLAMETGGFVADSLEMARFGKAHAAKNLIVVGVRFMGETAKILSPEKRIFMPDLDATCSLDLGCPADAFATFRAAHPNRTVVVYANTSAAVKAQADWMVTSSCALAIVHHLKEQGKQILWAPTVIWGITFKRKLVPICCSGMGPALCMMNLKLLSWNYCACNIPLPKY